MHETPAICACGHPPTPQAKDSCTTGVGWTRGDVPLCFDCSAFAEREDFIRAQAYFAYLSGDGKRIMTWTGHTLAQVSRETVRRVGYGGERTYLRAVDSRGQAWHGTSPGRNMYCRLRRAK